MKKCFPLFILLCSSGVAMAQIDTVAQKINNLPYLRVDVSAKFPGEPFEKYIADHIQLRHNSRTDINADAVLAMKVESNGTVSDIRLLKTVSPEVDNEIKRVAGTSPKWQPAMSKGEPASVYVVFDITISIKASAQASAKNKHITITSVATKNGFKTNNSAQSLAAKSPANDITTDPLFPGGDATFANYVHANLIYPTSSKRKKIAGRAIISFVVKEDGSITNIRVERAPAADLGLEAARVFKNSPKWRPGTKNGIPVAVTLRWPIDFKL